MYRLSIAIRGRAWGLLLAGLIAVAAGCAHEKPVVRDQLVVEELRMRITKVRNAIAETRTAIAASRGAPYLPEIYMRLAELLSEEARYHYMVAYEREQKRTKALHVPQVRFLKEQAIGTYEVILKKYPKSSLAPRILFNISHEQRELGNFDNMKSTLERLVRDYPNSPYRNEALLVLGDFQFDKLEFVQSENYYKDIVKEKDGALLGLAHYKLGWVYVNLGDCKRALENFENAILTARAYDAKKATQMTAGVDESAKHSYAEFKIPSAEDPKEIFAGHTDLNVQRDSLVDLTYCYAQERKPEKAAEYLRSLASTRDAYVSALSKMANRYALIEQPKGAAEVARELLRLAPDEEDRLDDARMLHGSIVRMKDYTEVGDDVSLILRVMRRQIVRPNQDKKAIARLVNEFEMMARDLATKSHEMVMKKAGEVSEWSSQPASPDETARAYRVYLEALPESKNRLEIMQNLADVLMEGKRFLDAGHSYREAAELLKKAPPEEKKKAKDAKAKLPAVGTKVAEEKKEDKPKTPAERRQERLDALYNAVVAYQNFLESEASKTHLERATARAGLRNAGGLLLVESTPDKDRSARIKFAVGQSYYDEGNYLEAIDLLTAVAYEFPGTQQGNAAVHIVLDSYSTINDISGLINVGRRFLAGDSPVSPEIKAQIGPIVDGAEQRRLDELSLAASGDQAGGIEVLLTFAKRYKGTDLGERAMLSAFVAARAGGNTEQLYSLGQEIIKQFPQSNQIGGVVSTMGWTATAQFEFDKALDFLERGAEMSPDQKPALLLTAGDLREQLGDKDGAANNYKKAIVAAGMSPKRAEAAVRLGDLAERYSGPAEVVASLQPLAEPPDPEIGSRLGLALLRTGKNDEAEQQLRNALDSASGASPGALARANYGLAEINLRLLEGYQPPQAMDTIEELIQIIDVALQGYLGAARQPDPTFSQAALARMARAAEIAAQKVEQIQIPADLSEEEKKMLKEALDGRVKGLKANRDEALGECAERAKTAFMLDEAGRSCIGGKAPTEDPVRFHPLGRRSKVGKLRGVDEARERLSRNAEDLQSLREVGKAFLDAGDAHAARIVLARTIEAGGGDEDLNLLGVASYQAGDTTGALDAFRRAKDAGSSAAVLNLAMVCDELGLKDLAAQTRKQAPKNIEGRLMSGARRGGAGGGK